MYNDIETMCFKMGIRTYTDTYFTQLVGSSPTKIGQDMPNPVGWIYGISIETDSVFPTDKTLPTIAFADAANLYLYFKDGTDLYINNMRCDRLVYTQPSAPNSSNPRRYFSVNIPRMTDLKQSYYNNPTGIGTTGAPVLIPLTIYYIDVASVDMLRAKGYIFDGARALPMHHAHKK